MTLKYNIEEGKYILSSEHGVIDFDLRLSNANTMHILFIIEIIAGPKAEVENLVPLF
jgi:hypothetical protein